MSFGTFIYIMENLFLYVGWVFGSSALQDENHFFIDPNYSTSTVSGTLITMSIVLKSGRIKSVE